MALIVPILGGGPAGMSCALWLHNYGLHPVIIEQAAALGGMARRNPYPNPWLLGRPNPTGRESAAAFARHIGEAGIECLIDAVPRRIARAPGGRYAVDVAHAGATRSLTCPALVIATGTEFRGDDWLDAIPNARALADTRPHLCRPCGRRGAGGGARDAYGDRRWRR